MREAAYSRSSTSIWRALLALGVALGVFLALTSVPAEAQTTFTVNKTGDAADRDVTDTKCDSKRKNGKQCTLRAAIEESNDTAGADTIEFDIGNTNSVKTISPDSALPEITEPVTIDGYTQRGARENTLDEGSDAVLKVELNGANVESSSGLRIDAAESTVKGLVINRFDGSGISVGGGSGNSIEGNFIGTNAAGTADRGNVGGVSIAGDSPDTTIGGTQPAERNLISGNSGVGVGAAGNSTANSIQGNYIGTTADGTGDLGNAQGGVRLFGSNNTVGGTEPGEANTISGNDGIGVQLSGSTNKIEGNFIGTAADGTGDLGNDQDGVYIVGADGNVVGGTASGAGNRIAHNGGDGVSVEVSVNGGTGNSVLSNSIFQNAGLGIDLLGGTEDANGVTVNDTDDPDTGENNLQNFPDITSATRNSTTNLTTITGTLNSNPSGSFTIQCFLTGGADPSGHGEGSFLLDTETVSDNDGDGDVNFTCTSSNPILGQLPNPIVSATATNTATGDTSEFSANEPVTTP